MQYRDDGWLRAHSINARYLGASATGWPVSSIAPQVPPTARPLIAKAGGFILQPAALAYNACRVPRTVDRESPAADTFGLAHRCGGRHAAYDVRFAGAKAVRALDTGKGLRSQSSGARRANAGGMMGRTATTRASSAAKTSISEIAPDCTPSSARSCKFPIFSWGVLVSCPPFGMPEVCPLSGHDRLPVPQVTFRGSTVLRRLPEWALHVCRNGVPATKTGDELEQQAYRSSAELFPLSQPALPSPRRSRYRR
jgi:hypothetical protein